MSITATEISRVGFSAITALILWSSVVQVVEESGSAVTFGFGLTLVDALEVVVLIGFFIELHMYFPPKKPIISTSTK